MPRTLSPRMSETTSKTRNFLAGLAALLIIALVILEVAWFGLSLEVFQRHWHNVLARPSGPMAFRFVLQPIMAAIAALHDGIRDARSGRTPYFWAILTGPLERATRLREGLTATARIILLGVGMDAIYQVTVLKTFYPGEAVTVAFALCFLPYLILRGPVARIARRLSAAAASGQAPPG